MESVELGTYGQKWWRAVESMEYRFYISVRRRPMETMEFGFIRRRSMEPMEFCSDNCGTKTQSMEQVELRSDYRSVEAQPMEPMEFHPGHWKIEPMELCANYATRVLQCQPRFWQIQLKQISRRIQLHVQPKLMAHHHCS